MPQTAPNNPARSVASHTVVAVKAGRAAVPMASTPALGLPRKGDWGEIQGVQAKSPGDPQLRWGGGCHL